MLERKIDDLGRIVIPKEMRRTLGLEKNMPVDITATGDSVIIRKGKKLCRVCGRELDHTNRFCICKSCLSEIRASV